jgi:hypothetical protein
MVSAFDEAKKLIQLLNRKRNDEQFDYLFSRAETIAERLEVDLKPKRRVGRQFHRENAVPDTSPVKHLRINMCFSVIDHVISKMERRFPDDLYNHMTGYYLMPKNLRNLTPYATELLSVAFDADRPCKGNFSVEIERWRHNVDDNPVHQNIPGLQSALADKDLNPNIHTIFILLIFLPVTSVCCARSFSALRRHKTWVRSTMTGERLCGLAMLHSHRSMAVNRGKILRRYDASGHRKIGRFFYGQLRHVQILIPLTIT